VPSNKRPNDCPGFYRASWSAILIMVPFFFSLTASPQLLSRDVVPPGIYSWLVALVPIILGALVLRSFIRFMRALDEFWVKIYLRALAFSFGVSFLAMVCYPILELVNAPQLDSYVFGAFSIFVFCCAAIYCARRYG
jgi:hypothetical protein